MNDNTDFNKIYDQFLKDIMLLVEEHMPTKQCSKKESKLKGKSNRNQLPKFFNNSCTGADSVHEDTGQSIISVVEGEGKISHNNWTKSFQHFPGFSENKIEEALIEQSGCFSKRYNAPKTCKSKKLGYRLWKEGFVRSSFVQPNVQGSMHRVQK